jgi:hypothetical protein
LEAQRRLAINTVTLTASQAVWRMPNVEFSLQIVSKPQPLKRAAIGRRSASLSGRRRRVCQCAAAKRPAHMANPIH